MHLHQNKYFFVEICNENPAELDEFELKCKKFCPLLKVNHMGPSIQEWTK